MQNQNNKKFYDFMPQRYLHEKCVLPGGLETFADLKFIWPYIKNDPSSKILEIGGGEGRIIEGLIQFGFQGELYVIERCSSYLPALKNQCAKLSPSSVKLSLGDVLKDSLPNADYSLMLFSFFLEFDFGEQLDLIRKVTLTTRKYIFIDTPQAKCTTNSQWLDDQISIINTDWYPLVGRNPTKEEIISHLVSTEFALHEVIKYSTNTNRQRQIYVLKKNNVSLI